MEGKPDIIRELGYIDTAKCGELRSVGKFQEIEDSTPTQCLRPECKLCKHSNGYKEPSSHAVGANENSHLLLKKKFLH